jgi:hypothetical protein
MIAIIPPTDDPKVFAILQMLGVEPTMATPADMNVLRITNMYAADLHELAPKKIGKSRGPQRSKYARKAW